MKAYWSLLAVLLVGCSIPHGHETDRDEMIRLFRTQDSLDTAKALAIGDSVLHDIDLRVRSWNDSLAHIDSLDLGYFYAIQATKHILEGEFRAATYTYLNALPWMAAMEPQAEAKEWRWYAETISSALTAYKSPNMARLSYQAFEHAKRLALASEDPRLYHLADSSYKAVARRVLTMPDSVRAAFGPPPYRPARIPWVLATLAAAFIAVSLAGAEIGQCQNDFGNTR